MQPAILHTSGDSFAVGLQHGEMFKDRLAAGMLGFYEEFWQRSETSLTALLKPFFLQSAAKKMVDRIFTARMRALPEETRKCLLGMAVASGLPYERVALVAVLPDILPYLHGKLISLSGRLAAQSGEAQFGCTSFFAFGPPFLYGRNLDFPGVGFWDKFPVIQTTRKPKRLATIQFTTVGVPLGGITGINEAGIVVCLHQHYSRAVALKGHLPFVVAEHVLEKARSLEEARDILDRESVSSAWAFVVSDSERRTAMVYEADAKTKGVRLIQGIGGAHANAFQTSGCQLREFTTSERMRFDNYYRRTRLEHGVSSIVDGNIEQACALLSDSHDPLLGREKISGRVVAQAHNIQSVLFDLTNRHAYLAVGESPVHQGIYRKLDLAKLFDGKGIDEPAALQLRGFAFEDPAMANAKREFVKSFAAHLSGDVAAAVRHAKESLAAVDADVESAMSCAILCINAGEVDVATVELANALTRLERECGSKELNLPPEYFEGALYLSRMHFAAGEPAHGEAIRAAALAHKDLKDARARQLLSRVQNPKSARWRQINPPFSMYLPLV